jgi:YHS domain-containing protein
MPSRRQFLALLAAMPALPTPGFAYTHEVYAPGGVALGGIDPVGYFASQAAVQGTRDHRLMWRGTTWMFGTGENMARFERNPTRFAPQFGGYCTMAMASGRLSTTDPNAWLIYDGRLYLTESMAALAALRASPEPYIAKALQYWPGILHG